MKFGRITKSACLVAPFAALTTGQAVANQPTDQGVPYGLWFWEDQAPSNLVRLSIERVDLNWKASVNGAVITPRIAGQKVVLSAPDGDRFEGRISSDGVKITGLWVQPQSRAGFSEMATRVVLTKTASGRWEIQFKEQARPFRVYLEVFESEGGAPRALLRNPERNEIVRSSGFAVKPLGTGAFELSAGSGDRRATFQITPTPSGALSVPFRRFETPLLMRKARAEDAVGFYTRSPDSVTARYKTPERIEDGWEVAAAAEAGFDVATLDAMIESLATRDPRSSRPNLMHSILVARSGKLVLEEYFHGYDRETPHDIRSVGKVFSPILIGALRHDGADIPLSDTPLPRVLASGGLDVDDPAKSEVTLEQLLAFTSGLDCDDGRDSPAEEDNQWNKGGALGFWRFTASVPMVATPR